MFQFTVTVTDAESFTDAVRVLKAWKGGELNETDNVVVGPPTMVSPFTGKDNDGR